MALDFQRYTDVDVESLEAPKPLPAGTYFATIVKQEGREVQYEQGVKTPVITITFRLLGADDDVDPDALPEGGGVGRTVTRDYRLNDPDKAGQWQLRKLAEDTCRLPVKGYKLTDLLPLLIQQEVKIFNTPVPSRTEEGVYFPRVTKVLSVHPPLERAA